MNEKRDKKYLKMAANPQGPYKIKMDYRGVTCAIAISNVDEHEFDIKIRANKKLAPSQIEGLKEYLEAEGFNAEARKHNLFW